MVYAFQPRDDCLQTALRRIAASELAAAETRLRQPDDGTIHACRKHLKKTRALLRLLRSGLPEQPAENAALRRIGLALSRQRDAEVRLTTLSRLFPDGLPPALQPFGAALRVAVAANAQHPGDLANQIAALRHRAARWRLQGKDGAILRWGLSRTLRDLALCQARAAAAPEDPEALHDWRKRAKDHWYQARLFAPCCPQLFTPLIAEAETLTEALGDQRDLQALAQAALARPDLLSPPGQALLARQIAQHSARLHALCQPIAARLETPKPDETARLWVKHYKRWRC